MGSVSDAHDPAATIDWARRMNLLFDRILWLRSSADGDGTSWTVAGVRRRRPVEMRVDGQTAAALVAAGVPTVHRSAEPV